MKYIMMLSFLLSATSVVRGAVLDRYKGKVTIRGKTSLSPGQKLQAGDHIIASGEKSFFVVKYLDGSRFLVRNGELKIKKMQQKSSRVGLLRGTFLSFVQPDSQHDLKVETRTAALGVRGTKFWASESDKDTYLCVCEGEVEVKNDIDSVVVAKNEDIRVSSRDQKLVKSIANNMMWNMAVDGFKELGIVIRPR